MFVCVCVCVCVCFCVCARARLRQRLRRGRSTKPPTCRARVCVCVRARAFVRVCCEGGGAPKAEDEAGPVGDDRLDVLVEELHVPFQIPEYTDEV